VALAAVVAVQSEVVVVVVLLLVHFAGGLDLDQQVVGIL